MVVAQKHCRALAFNKGWKENLEKFLDKLPQGRKARFASFVDDLREGFEKEETPKKKKLKAHSSDISPVSKDEFGLPVLALGEGTGDELLEGLEKEPLPSRKKDIRALFKKPGGKVKKKAPKSKKTKSMKKGPAPSKAQKKEAKAAPPGTKLYYITRGSLQSYITAQEPGQSKKYLWVAITKAQTIKHTAIAEKIWIAKPTSKQAALDMREKFLAEG